MWIPQSATRYVRFWVDEIPIDEGVPSDERQSQVPIASRDGNRALVPPERREPQLYTYERLLGGIKIKSSRDIPESG